MRRTFGRQGRRDSQSPTGTTPGTQLSSGPDAAPDGRALLDRLDSLPGWALPKFNFVVLGIAYLFVFYDISDIGFGMPAISAQYHLSDNAVKFVAVAIGLIGYIFGSIAIGALSDRRGRRSAFVMSLVISGIGSLGCALATGLVTLSIWRFVTGVGVGAALNMASTYVGELAPPSQRGRLSVTTFLVGIIGQAVTPFVALGLVPHFFIGWRLLFAIGAVIGILGVLFALMLPESPRWLIEHKHNQEAQQLILAMESRFSPDALARARERHAAAPAAAPQRETAPAASWGELLHGRYATPVFAMTAMWFLWYIGNYGFLGDAATLFSAHGLGIGSSILYLAVGAVGYPVGAVLMILTSDRVERKYLIFAATVVWLVGMLLVATLADSAVVTVGSFLASLALGCYLQVAYTFTAENFPTRLRARGFSIADGGGHLGGAVGALLLPTVVTATSFFTGFALIGVTGLLAGVIALAGPKASGKKLEEVSWTREGKARKAVSEKVVVQPS